MKNLRTWLHLRFGRIGELNSAYYARQRVFGSAVKDSKFDNDRVESARGWLRSMQTNTLNNDNGGER